MITLNNDLLTEFQKYSFIPCLLFRFYDGTNYYRYTDMDVPIYYADDSTSLNKFEPKEISYSRISYSMTNIVDDSQVKIDNRDGFMTEIFNTSDDYQGEEGKIWVAVLDEYGEVIASLVLFKGSLDDFELDEEYINISIVSIFSEWERKTNFAHPSRCRWKEFKGIECKYAGSNSECNRLYETCQLYGNGANFGGFRWLPDLENKEIIWGPAGNTRRV